MEMDQTLYIKNLDGSFSVADPQTRPGSVLAMVACERKRQDQKFGGPLTQIAFIQLIQDHAAWARVKASMGDNKEAETLLVSAAAYAIAGVEDMHRNDASRQHHS